jgi:hypothetical protein
MKFTIDNAVPPSGNVTLQKVIKLIRELPDGEMLSMRGVASKATLSEQYISSFGALIPADICVKHAQKKLYGNPKTIAAWKKQQVQH